MSHYSAFVTKWAELTVQESGQFSAELRNFPSIMCQPFCRFIHRFGIKSLSFYEQIVAV